MQIYCEVKQGKDASFWSVEENSPLFSNGHLTNVSQQVASLTKNSIWCHKVHHLPLWQKMWVSALCDVTRGVISSVIHPPSCVPQHTYSQLDRSFGSVFERDKCFPVQSCSRFKNWCRTIILVCLPVFLSVTKRKRLNATIAVWRWLRLPPICNPQLSLDACASSPH